MWHLVDSQWMLILHSNVAFFILSMCCSDMNVIAVLPERILGHGIASRDESPLHDVRASVSLLCAGGGCEMELGKRHRVIAQLSVNWVGTGKHMLTQCCCVSCVFPSFHFLFYSTWCLIPWLFLSSGTADKGVNSEPWKQEPIEKNKMWCWVCYTGS